MNLSPEWEEYLFSNGIEAQHWSSVGSAQAHDGEIIQFADEHEYTVLTGDLDFGIMLVTSRRSTPSVVQIRSESTLPEEIGTNVLRALAESKESLLRGALVTVDPNRIRVRILSAVS